MKHERNAHQAAKITYQGYSWGLKISIIEEIENGQISINQASKKYDIGRSTIQKWMNKFGNLDKKLREMGGKSPKQEIEELKKKLARMEMERNILESAIEIVEEEYGFDVKKKFLTPSQKDTLRRIKKG
jgi:transposase-like protein